MEKQVTPLMGQPKRVRWGSRGVHCASSQRALHQIGTPVANISEKNPEKHSSKTRKRVLKDKNKIQKDRPTRDMWQWLDAPLNMLSGHLKWPLKIRSMGNLQLVFLVQTHLLYYSITFIGIQIKFGGFRSHTWHPKPSPKACLARLCASRFDSHPSKMKVHC